MRAETELGAASSAHRRRSAAPRVHYSARHLVFDALGFVLLLTITGCGSESAPMSEDYGNLLASPAGLVIVQEEHPTGWTRPDCFSCHDVNNIHQVNRTGLSDAAADLAGVRTIVNNQGLASCPLCHGNNGVAQ
jgi:hypothetical protein